MALNDYDYEFGQRPMPVDLSATRIADLAVQLTDSRSADNEREAKELTRVIRPMLDLHMSRAYPHLSAEEVRSQHGSVRQKMTWDSVVRSIATFTATESDFHMDDGRRFATLVFSNLIADVINPMMSDIVHDAIVTDLGVLEQLDSKPTELRALVSTRVLSPQTVVIVLNGAGMYGTTASESRWFPEPLAITASDAVARALELRTNELQRLITHTRRALSQLLAEPPKLRWTLSVARVERGAAKLATTSNAYMTVRDLQLLLSVSQLATRLSEGRARLRTAVFGDSAWANVAPIAIMPATSLPPMRTLNWGVPTERLDLK